MRWQPVKALFWLLPMLLLSSCSSLTARKAIELDGFRRVFVEERLNDNVRLHELLVAELRRQGREASSGPLTMMPQNTEAVLTYDARWEWNFRTYLVELNLELHTARSRKKLAEASYRQPSLVGKSHAHAVRESVARMFGP
jgi:hypothetical protein